jgi:hypothetical protein
METNSTLLWNVGFYQPIHMMNQPKRISSELSPPWKSLISSTQN